MTTREHPKLCFKCQKPLQQRNVTGACQAHYGLTPQGKQTKREWCQKNKEKMRQAGAKSRTMNRNKIRLYQQAYFNRHKDRILSERKTQRHSWDSTYSKYGLSVAEYNHLLESQGGVCFICRSSHPGRKSAKRLCVDHCHETGVVRGLLCSKCNLSIGHLKDDPERAKRVVSYLERFLKNKPEQSQQPACKNSE